MPIKYDDLIRRQDAIAVAEANGFLSVDDILSIEPARGIGGRKHVPISIRGTVFPSINAAAKAFGVSVNTVKSAKRNGRLDNVGFGKGYRNEETKKKVYEQMKKEIHFMGCVFNGWDEAKHVTEKSRSYMLRHGAVAKMRLGKKADQE